MKAPGIVFLCSAAVFCVNTGTAGPPAQEFAGISELRREIVLLNLLNGLYLTGEQKKAIAGICEQAENIRNEYRVASRSIEQEMTGVLAELRAVLIGNQEISPELKNRVHRMEKRRYALEDAAGDKLLALEAEVKSLLNPNQIQVIETFRPCMIPPDQGNIGQSVELQGEYMVQSLNRIRDIPVGEYVWVRGMLADMHIDRVERHAGLFSDSERQAYKDKILETYDEIRRMSDREYFIKRAEIAGSFVPEDRSQARRSKNQPGLIGRLLLDPAAIQFLDG